MSQQLKKILYYSSVSGIILLSFFFYSSDFYVLLGSDDAIQVLMIHNFQLPHDLYFWGQDRYGSLIPMLGQLFYRGMGFSALTSESVTHYLVLIAGYFAVSSLLKSKFSRLILAVIWFFPPIRLIDFLRLNIGLEYSLLAIGIFLINKLHSVKSEQPILKKHLLLLAITLIFITAVWVSDLAAISVLLILILHIYYSVDRKSIRSETGFNWKPGIFYAFGGFLVGVVFIVYAKFYADKSPSYNNFNDLHAIIESLRIFGVSISELLLFKASEPFTSVSFYLIIVLTVSLFVLRKQIIFRGNQKKWFLFFVLDFVLIFSVIMVSKWALLNGVPRRYFVSSYIAFWIAFLLAFEYLSESRIKRILRMMLAIAVVVAGIGSLYNLNYIWPKTLKPRVEYVREFESLGSIGIIGNYWNSYINSVTNPEQIIATPNDKSSIRNKKMARETMKRDVLYVIRDGWMESFPDSLVQFGIPLYKEGEEFRMGDCYVCRYKKKK